MCQARTSYFILIILSLWLSGISLVLCLQLYVSDLFCLHPLSFSYFLFKNKPYHASYQKLPAEFCSITHFKALYYIICFNYKLGISSRLHENLHTRKLCVNVHQKYFLGFSLLCTCLLSNKLYSGKSCDLSNK